MSDPIIMAMATFPPRKKGMLRVLRDLLPQCDKFYLYMNGYTEVPKDMPQSPKLEIILAGPGMPNPDMGSQGKLHWIGSEPGYYLTVDDDLLYPPDYAAVMVQAVERYGRKAIVTAHGSTFKLKPDGSPLPTGFMQDSRQLYGYDQRVDTDIRVHANGNACTASYPRALGLNRDVITGEINSSDDADTSVWAQQHDVAVIRIITPARWITGDNTVGMCDPLHRRMRTRVLKDKKFRSVGHWRLPACPPMIPGFTPKCVAPAPVKAARVLSSRIRPVNLPPNRILPRRSPPRPASVPARVVPRTRSAPPSVAAVAAVAGDATPVSRITDISQINLSPADISYCERIMSSDALAFILVDRIRKRVPTSVVRMADGEHALMALLDGEAPAPFLQDPQWLARYGLTGANLTDVAGSLKWAGVQADYLACSIHGLVRPEYKVHTRFPERKTFIDQFYTQLWAATGRIQSLLNAGPVLVLHRRHEDICAGLTARYGIADVAGIKLDSWETHAALVEQVKASNASTVLVSGGPAGKYLCVRLAQEAGKVVLDVGEALGGCWLAGPDLYDASGRLISGSRLGRKI